MKSFIFIIIFIISAYNFPVNAETKIEKIGNNFSYPWGMSFINDDEIIITERRGKIFKVNWKSNEKVEIVNVPNVLNKHQGGMLDIIVNGYDGDNLILYDPWGRIYTAKASNYLYAVEKRFLSDKIISGSHRTRFTYGKKKKRDWLNFDHFIGNSGLKKYHNILNTKTNIGIR